MLALMCIWVACAAGFALFVENIIGWFLFFSPGWAIDFPFGLSYQTALSIGLTSYLLLMLTTAVACVGGIVGFICTLLRIEWANLGRDRRIWFWFAAVFWSVAAVIFWCVFVTIGPEPPNLDG